MHWDDNMAMTRLKTTSQNSVSFGLFVKSQNYNSQASSTSQFSRKLSLTLLEVPHGDLGDDLCGQNCASHRNPKRQREVFRGRHNRFPC